MTGSDHQSPLLPFPRELTLVTMGSVPRFEPFSGCYEAWSINLGKRFNLHFSVIENHRITVFYFSKLSVLNEGFLTCTLCLAAFSI